MEFTKMEYSSQNASQVLQASIAQQVFALSAILATTAKVVARLKTLERHQPLMTLLEVYVQFKTIVNKERVTQDLAMLALGNPLRISSLAQLVRKVTFVKVMALKFYVQLLTIAMATSHILLESYAQEDSMVAKLRQAFMKSRTVLLVQLLHSAKAEDSLGNAQLGIFVNRSLILQHQLIWI